MKQILTFIFILAIYGQAFSQTQIDRSDDLQIMLLGRKFYVHKVKPGETIYALSKVYEVPTEQILLINSEEITNLQAGTLIRIPLIDSTYKPFPLSKTTFTYHIVQKNESMYAIAKQYNITQDELIKYNPQVTNGLKKGMQLKIPVKKRTELKGEDELFVYHQLRRGENLQTIAGLYNVNLSVLQKLNSEVEIVEGNVVAVPKKQLSEEQIYLLKHNESLKPNFFDIDPNYFEDSTYPPCSKFVYDPSMTFKISFLLPLYLDQNNDLSIKSLSPKNSPSYFGKSQVFYSFLQGSLMAVEKLKGENVNLEIKIFDTNNDSAEVSKILADTFVRNSDLVIGPVYSEHYNQVKKFTNETHINVVSPFSHHESTLKNNPFVFQPEPSTIEITKFTSKFIAQKIDTSLVFFITDENEANKELSDTLKKYIVLNSKNPDSLKYKNVVFSKFITPYQDDLSETKNNIVFIPTTDENKIAAILNNLNALVTVYNYKITVYTMPAIRYSTKLQVEWFSNLNIHYTGKFKNSDKWENMEFTSDYKRNFGENTNKFVYMGYDETYYFVNLLRQYGKYFQFCMNEKAEINDTGEFMEFYFKRTGLTNGFENIKMNMYYYTKDLQIQQEEEPTNYEEYFFHN